MVSPRVWGLRWESRVSRAELLTALLGGAESVLRAAPTHCRHREQL